MRNVGRSGSAAVTVLVIVVLVGAAAAAAWYFLLRSTPERTVTAVLTAAAERDAQTIHGLVTENSQGMVDNWMSAISFLVSRGTPEDPAWSLGEVQVEGGRATVPVLFKLPESVRGLFGETMTVDHALVKDGRTWKVDLPQTLKNLGTSFLGGNLLGGPGRPESEG